MSTPAGNVVCGITMNAGDKYGTLNNELTVDYIHWMEDAAIRPVLIPNGLANYDDWLNNLHGLIFSGGNDVSIAAGIPPDQQRSASPVRDRSEGVLMDRAATLGLPVLGICRGFQFINACMNGRLRHQHFPANTKHSHLAVNHEVEIVDEGWKQALGSDRFTVNSFHNGAVKIDDLGPELRAAAVEPKEGLVEAYYHMSRPLWGVQWHPERPGNDARINDFILSVFLNGMRKFQKGRFLR